jgi:hypothetical protein
MSKITGSLSATLGAVTVAPVTTADAHLAIAQQFMEGARVLAAAPNCALPLAFISGHISECLFKAFLSWKGETDATLKGYDIGHNLSALRAMAVKHGLTVDPAEPQWLATLSSLHGRPFHLRYPVGLNGLVTPGSQPMLSDLEALQKVIEAARP